jgi:hypothetical protein
VLAIERAEVMTLETLATIKNPPVLSARQANIANGPQPSEQPEFPRRTILVSAPRFQNLAQNELLERAYG